MDYVGSVNKGDRGHIAIVENSERAYEIHPLGEAKERQFYSLKAAIDLAHGHAQIINAKGDSVLNSSWVRIR